MTREDAVIRFSVNAGLSLVEAESILKGTGIAPAEDWE